MRWLMLTSVLLVAACSQNNGQQPLACFIPKIDEAPQSANAKSSQWDANATSCVEHWSRALAASRDSPDTVADAAVHACDESFNSEAIALARELPANYSDADATKRKLEADAKAEALFDIEAFRAARCDGPKDPLLS